MKYAKSQLEIAAERYGIDPRRFGRTRLYSFVFEELLAGEQTNPVRVRTNDRCLLLSLIGNPSDGAAGSYAGLDLLFTYAGIDLCSDGQSQQPASFAALFGRADHPSWDWRVPILLEGGTDMLAQVTNNTAGTVTPKLFAEVVEITG